MPRLVACRRCGKPSAKSLCDACRGETYGSTEYQRNSAIIRAEVQRRMAFAAIVHCVICGQAIIRLRDVTIEHMRPVSQGGSNHLSNLGPAHAKCNYAKRPSY